MKITIPKQCDPGAMCGEKGPRYDLSKMLVFSAGDKAYIASTNANALTVVPVEGAGPIWPTLIEAVRRQRPRGLIIVDSDIRPEAESRWPDFSAVFPEIKSCVATTINAYLLSKIIKATGATWLDMFSCVNGTAIVAKDDWSQPIGIGVIAGVEKSQGSDYSEKYCQDIVSKIPKGPILQQINGSS